MWQYASPNPPTLPIPSINRVPERIIRFPVGRKFCRKRLTLEEKESWLLLSRSLWYGGDSLAIIDLGLSLRPPWLARIAPPRSKPYSCRGPQDTSKKQGAESLEHRLGVIAAGSSLPGRKIPRVCLPLRDLSPFHRTRKGIYSGGMTSRPEGAAFSTSCPIWKKRKDGP